MYSAGHRGPSMNTRPVRMQGLRCSVAALRAPDRSKLANGGNRTVDDNVVVAEGIVPFLHMATLLRGEYCRAWSRIKVRLLPEPSGWCASYNKQYSLQHDPLPYFEF